MTRLLPVLPALVLALSVILTLARARRNTFWRQVTK